jgi:hypothetical protein
VRPRQTDRRRPGFGAAWWLAMGFSLALIAAGAAIGFLGPRLFPRPAGARPAPAAGLATRPGPAKQPPPTPARIGPP